MDYKQGKTKINLAECMLSVCSKSPKIGVAVVDQEQSLLEP